MAGFIECSFLEYAVPLFCYAKCFVYFIVFPTYASLCLNILHLYEINRLLGLANELTTILIFEFYVETSHQS